MDRLCLVALAIVCAVLSAPGSGAQEFKTETSVAATAMRTKVGQGWCGAIRVDLRPCHCSDAPADEALQIPVTLTDEGTDLVYWSTERVPTYSWLSSLDEGGPDVFFRDDVCTAGAVYGPYDFTSETDFGDGADDGYVRLDLPFAFPFYGREFTGV